MNTEAKATYCPEDDKLRLYVGRVPRDEYLALKKEGWTSTPKQDCDFVATWTPAREDTALEYAGIIEDEDQGPKDRAADRAERFAEYREKRRAEATGHADTYDEGPAVHGFASQHKAEQCAKRHDLHAAKAVNAWGKAEYWQHRTAGVISHALYCSSPSVRQGRIKRLEAELKRVESYYTGEAYTAPDGQRYVIVGQGRGTYPINPDQIEPRKKLWARTVEHIKLRLLYENAMLQAAGGRAGELDIAPGWTMAGATIAKVNKSTTSGRVVSVQVIAPRSEGWTYNHKNIPGTPYGLLLLDAERASPEAFAEPTPESLAILDEFKKAQKAGKKKPLPLINPTPELAQLIQDAWNKERGELHEVLTMTANTYTDHSRGTYAKMGTSFCAPDLRKTWEQYRGNTSKGAAFRVRCTYTRVIVLADKPQHDGSQITLQPEEAKA